MADDLRALEDWAGALLNQVQPAERRKVTQTIARELRRSQQQRIAAQRNPDGTPYAPRKPRQQLRAKAGRIKQRKMFAKLRTARYLHPDRHAGVALRWAADFGRHPLRHAVPLQPQVHSRVA